MEDRSLPDVGDVDGLPRAAHLAAWLACCARGEVSPDDFVDAVRGDDPAHIVVDANQTTGLIGLLSLARRTHFLLVAAPAPGDPVGLAGPSEFNAAAIEAGSALVFAGTGVGVVPVLDARTIVWQVQPAATPPPLDPGDCDRQLRALLTTTATTLAEEDVVRWAPEIPDLLLNSHHRTSPDLPPSYAGRRAGSIERATLCLEAAALAPHHPALADLARAARRAVVALCSDSLATS